MNEMEELLEQAAVEGIITCPECGNNIEPDCPKCQCGWKNKVLSYGLI